MLSKNFLKILKVNTKKLMVQFF